VSQQVARVDTLFLHESGDEYRTVVQRDGDRVLTGWLELKETEAGPRPARLRVVDGSEEDLRSPDQFVELARRADRIRISEQTSSGGRDRLRAMLDGYQLDAKVVRTCRLCAKDGHYSPITAETAISTEPSPRRLRSAQSTRKSARTAPARNSIASSPTTATSRGQRRTAWNRCCSRCRIWSAS